MKIEEAVSLNLKLLKLKTERPNAVLRLSAAQNFPIDWSLENLVESKLEDARVIIPAAWQTSYD